MMRLLLVVLLLASVSDASAQIKKRRAPALGVRDSGHGAVSPQHRIRTVPRAGRIVTSPNAAAPAVSDGGADASALGDGIKGGGHALSGAGLGIDRVVRIPPTPSAASSGGGGGPLSPSSGSNASSPVTTRLTSDFAVPDAAPVSCTKEALVCPDGSLVGRIAPSCSFAPCPVASGGVKTPRCTQDTMTCPDGSQVGRSGPTCSFAPCPLPSPALD